MTDQTEQPGDVTERVSATTAPDDGVEDDAEVVTAEIVEVPARTAESLGLILPEDPEEARSLLLAELGEARDAAESYLDDLQRVVADFDNYRKRIQREQKETVARASERVVVNLLAVLDSFDVAFTHDPQTPAEEKLIAGMRSTYQLLLDVLSKEGLEPIVAEGVPFDPEVHEAVQAPQEGDGTLIVSQELRRGYTLAGRVVRPAMVAVDHA